MITICVFVGRGRGEFCINIAQADSVLFGLGFLKVRYVIIKVIGVFLMELFCMLKKVYYATT